MESQERGVFRTPRFRLSRGGSLFPDGPPESSDSVLRVVEAKQPSHCSPQSRWVECRSNRPR